VRENLTATAGRGRSGKATWTLDTVTALFPWIAERRQQLGASLSGGEQQMLAIARALMTNPELLILDEATEGLAPVIRQAIWQVLRKLKDAGQSIFLIDKNLREVLRLADRHYVIERGCVMWSGTSAELAANYAHIHRFLGV
jgi:branched-chain amino acid transport system ATP-binding protein